MREIYNESNNLGIANAFQVAIDKVIEEKEPEFYGRDLVPFTDGSGYGISIGDKTVEWRKLKSIATAEIVEERDDDIPFAYSAGGVQIAKTHWIRSGMKMSIDEKDKLKSANGDYEAKKFTSQANAVVNTVKKAENDILIYGYEPLNRIGIMNMPGKRTFISGLDMEISTGAEILQMYIDAVEEFEEGGSETFVPRTLAIDRSLYAILQRPYNKSMDSGVSILTRINERNLFQRIKVVKKLINPLTGKPTQLIEDDVEENFQAIDIRPLLGESWDVGRTTYLAAEQKESEILPFKPEAILELQTL